MSNDDTSVVTPPAESTVSLEAFNAMKSQLEQRNEELAHARAQSEVFEARERQRIGSWQSDVKALVTELMEAGDSEMKADIAPLEPWVAEFASKKDIIAQRPLARVMAEASKTLKRERAEASNNKEAAAALSVSMKELDDVKGERDTLRQRLDEMSGLAEERQQGMLKLQAELVKAGLLSDKHDFSKVLNREVPGSESKSEEPKAPSKVVFEVKKASVDAPTRSVNPLEDNLLNMCMRGQGTSRIVHSGTSHSFLGSSSSGTDEVMAAIRAY